MVLETNELLLYENIERFISLFIMSWEEKYVKYGKLQNVKRNLHDTQEN